MGTAPLAHPPGTRTHEGPGDCSKGTRAHKGPDCSRGASGSMGGLGRVGSSPQRLPQTRGGGTVGTDALGHPGMGGAAVGASPLAPGQRHASEGPTG